MVSEIVLNGMREALQALRTVGSEAVLIGGLGIQYYGRIRQTKDADFLAAIDESSFEAVFQAAETLGLMRDPNRPILRIGNDTILRLYYVDPKFSIQVRIDVIQANNEFLKKVVVRAHTTKVFGEILRLATCEDLILLKLLAARPIDQADAAELIRANRKTIDWGYLRSEAATLRLVEDLANAEQESQKDFW